MENIIKAVDKKLLVEELNKDRFLRKTNFGGNEIYSVTAHNAPNVMREIGRLREITFRNAGGGTGKSMDIDEFDTAEVPYHQLIVWNPEEKEILGGYRYFFGKDATFDENGKVKLATAGLLDFSDKFIQEYLPRIIELGRSYVRSDEHISGRRSLYTLDNLWDGLGALMIDHKDVEFFFGKVTMYLKYNRNARDLILYFMKTVFPDRENLIKPYNPLKIETDENELKNIFIGANYKENHKILSQKVREYGETIPPLINSYMNLSATMMTFGTSLNETFGDVEETGILVNLNDMYTEKTERHVNSYLKELEERK